MPDYCGCIQEKCNKKNNCARYLMKFSTCQSITKPEKWDECKLFWDIKNGFPFNLCKYKAENINTKKKI